MAVSARHVLNHGPMLGALARAALSALRTPAGAIPAELPGPEFTATIPPPPVGLVRDFVEYLGGDARAYRDQLPPHLFSMWAFPLAARTLQGLPYPMIKTVNGGCRMEVLAPLPIGEPLTARAQLLSIDDDGRRAVMESRVITGTEQQPDCLVTDFYAIVPLPKKADDDSKRTPREKPTVPEGAHELMRRQLRRDAGMSFAKLTGDFNPIHWLSPYARASGFGDVILQGFGTLALTAEGLIRHRFGGDPGGLKMLDVKFKRPLVLPHDVGLFQHGDQIFMGDAPGGPAYMVGTFATTATTEETS